MTMFNIFSVLVMCSVLGESILRPALALHQGREQQKVQTDKKSNSVMAVIEYILKYSATLFLGCI